MIKKDMIYALKVQKIVVKILILNIKFLPLINVLTNVQIIIIDLMMNVFMNVKIILKKLMVNICANV